MGPVEKFHEVFFVRDADFMGLPLVSQIEEFFNAYAGFYAIFSNTPCLFKPLIDKCLHAAGQNRREKFLPDKEKYLHIIQGTLIIVCINLYRYMDSAEVEEEDEVLLETLDGETCNAEDFEWVNGE